MKRETRSHDEMPATVGLIKKVRAELKEEIQGVEANLKGEIQDLRGEIHGVKGEIQGLKGEIHMVAAAVYRCEVLMEEQRSENRIVLDGLKTVIDRQNRFEQQYPCS